MYALIFMKTVVTVKSTENLKSKYKTKIRLLSGANTKPDRGYKEKSLQLRTLCFRILIVYQLM